MANDAKSWLKTINSRYKQLHKDWMKEAKATVQVYEADDSAKVPFNILFSNTETILPTLYNSTPRPDVAKRFGQPDEAKDSVNYGAAQFALRTLEYVIDTNDPEYETFDEATRSATLSALVPGLGQVRVRAKDDEGYQSICFEHLAYDRFLWGFSRAWKSVPWVAYGHDLSRSDFEKTYPEVKEKDWYKKVDWEAKEKEADDANQGDAAESPNRPSKEPTLLVWEIWDWATKTILHVCEESVEEYLDEESYPEGIGFKFPSPEPLRFLKRVNNLNPIPPYRMYKAQAEELNELTRRMKRIAKAIKVRGVYNSSISEFEQIFSDDDSDTVLVPSTNAAAFSDKGLEGNIWLIPVEKLMEVYSALNAEREAVKAVIFELSGIADIQRGSATARVSAKAEEIKNQWSTLRTKRAQRDVQIFCRDLMRIAVDFASCTFSPKTFKDITQLPYPYAAQKQQAQAAMQQMQGMMAQHAQMAQAAQQQGQQPPPPPPQPPQAMVAALKMPTVEDCLQVLRSQFSRQYSIDIESNSTVDLEATEDKAQVAEFMNAFGQMMAGFGPLLEQNILAWPLMKEAIKEVTRKFRFGRDIQWIIDQMEAPKPKEQDGAQQLALLKQKHSADMAVKDAQVQKSLLDAQQETSRVLDDVTALQGALEREKLLRIKDQIIAAGKQVSAAEGLQKQAGREGGEAIPLLQAKVQGMLDEAMANLDAQLSRVESQPPRGAVAPGQPPAPSPEMQALMGMQQQIGVLLDKMSQPRRIMRDGQGKIAGIS